MGRYAQNLFNSSTEQLDIPNVFSMSISGMKYNGTEDALTGNGTMNGNKMTEKESFIFISTNSEGIEGDINIQLGAGSHLILWINCEIKITYIPSAAPVHAHDFTYTLVGNTLTATCGGTDGLECSLTNHQVSTSLNADDSFDSDPAMIFPATLTGFTFFSKETGATKGNISYVNNTTSENLGTTTPGDPGQYTASITINAGGANHTLTKTYNMYSYAQINNIYPQLNFSTEKYASTTAAGANETVTITFTPKFGETLETLTVTGATTHNYVTLTQTGANTYTFIMPSENVTIGATFSISEDDFAETGTDEALKPIVSELKGQEARLAAINQMQDKKKAEEITQEEKDDKANTQKAIDEQKAKKQQVIADYAAKNDIVHQLIDLALLQNGMLKGEALDRFLRRSVELIK